MRHLLLSLGAVAYWLILGVAFAWVPTALMLAATWRDHLQHLR